MDKENKFCRYSEVRTYKDNKVEINSKNGYINASWIHIPYHKSFIATQGPLESTIGDFWEMCYSYNVKVIVMLCKLDENYKEKCANYWDTNLKNYIIQKTSETIQLNDGLRMRKFRIIRKDNNKDNNKENKEINNNYIINNNNIYNNNNKDIGKDIIQIHFTCWPDHSIPESAYYKIIDIIHMVDKYKGGNPVVVHCSAGIGRTGTFISLYNLYHEITDQINNLKIKEIRFSIMNLVRKLKEMRLYLVESENQYTFLYQFVNLFLKQNNTLNNFNI